MASYRVKFLQPFPPYNAGEIPFFSGGVGRGADTAKEVTMSVTDTKVPTADAGRQSWMTLLDTARLLDLKGEHVVALVRSGQLVRRRGATGLLISRASIARYLQRRRPR